MLPAPFTERTAPKVKKKRSGRNPPSLRYESTAPSTTGVVEAENVHGLRAPRRPPGDRDWWESIGVVDII